MMTALRESSQKETPPEVENFSIDRTIEKYIPKRFSQDALVFILNTPRYEYNLDTLNSALTEPIWEFLNRGGKRWRPKLFLHVCKALGKDPDDYLEYAMIPEVIHNGTLMVDDVEDQSELRRGKPCTYKTYGLDVAINSGNAMYFLPLLPLIHNEKRIPSDVLVKLYDTYAQHMISLSFGQAIDISWHRGEVDLTQITENQYLQMCAYKTGTLAAMAAKMAAILSQADDTLIARLGEYAAAIGVAFQIQDDILDLTGKTFAKAKGTIGADITEGKTTLIVIHTIQKASPTDRNRLMKILRMHTTDQSLRDEAIAIMKKYAAILYAQNYAQKILKESWNAIDDLLPPSEAKKELRAFADLLVEREL
ncbi:MAG: polyprenyl synthetase family protein [Candidatus Bathyarchaeota archaeon]|nr:MAG: polyprenyl synthetase family protein [Candidatus Bathyarchaeota archaeon]